MVALQDVLSYRFLLDSRSLFVSPDFSILNPNSPRRGTGGAMRQFALLWTFPGFAPVLWAQSPSTIGGTAVDRTQAVLPSTAVRLPDKSDNELGNNLTGSDGRFYFNGVATGGYHLAQNQADARVVSCWSPVAL